MPCLLVFSQHTRIKMIKSFNVTGISWTSMPYLGTGMHLILIKCGHCTGCRWSFGFSSNCLLMHAINNGTSPAYIADTATTMSSLHGHRRHHCATINQYKVPRTWSKFDDRAFSVAGLREWNNLPRTTEMFHFF